MKTAITIVPRKDPDILWLFVDKFPETIDGKGFVGKPIEFRETTPFAQDDEGPTMELTLKLAEELMLELWEKGVRPAKIVEDCGG